MKMIKIPINDRSVINKVSNVISKILSDDKDVNTTEVVIRNKVSDRNSIQNALLWHWCGEIYKQSDNYSSPYEVQAEIKLNIGVPIMKADVEFMNVWKHVQLLPYEVLLSMMLKKNKCYIPITSIMNVKQMNSLLTITKMTYEQKNMVLTDSKDMYYKQMGWVK